MKRLLIQGIRIYQICFTVVMGPRCRFYPSCSEYAREAIESHGPLKGSLLAIRRIGRCHPFHPGGVDPIPEPTHPAGKG
ncbi:MAG: membrane protein insertion efficiency factor YidD [Pseudomonadales bacterium]